MKLSHAFGFILLILSSCSGSNEKSNELPGLPLTHKDFIERSNPGDTLGTRISIIHFKTRSNGHEIPGSDDSWA